MTWTYSRKDSLLKYKQSMELQMPCSCSEAKAELSEPRSYMPHNPHKIQFHYHFIYHLVVNAVSLEILREDINVSFNTALYLNGSCKHFLMQPVKGPSVHQSDSQLVIQTDTQMQWEKWC